MRRVESAPSSLYLITYNDVRKVIGIIFRLIQHCKLLLVNKQEQLCGRVLTTLTKMIASTKYNLNHQAFPKPMLQLFSLTNARISG